MASKTKTKEAPLHLNVSYVWLDNLTTCSLHPGTTAHFQMKNTKRNMCLECVHDWEEFKTKKK